jgi:hypothetical protein
VDLVRGGTIDLIDILTQLYPMTDVIPACKPFDRRRAVEDNEYHPHCRLKMRSPREFTAAQIATA